MVEYLSKNPALKINQPQGKFIIRQLISNIADFWWKKNVLTQNERSFKNISCKKNVHNWISVENREFHRKNRIRIREKTTVHLKIINHTKSSYFQNCSWKIAKFADFRENNSVFTQKKLPILKIAEEIKVNISLIYLKKSRILTIF